MTDLIERELSAAFALKADSLPPAVGERLRDFDYRPRERRWRAGRAGFGALGAAATAVVAVVVVLLSSGAPAAFAGWTALPTKPSAAALATARATCGSIPSRDVLAAEQRGPFTAIVYKRGSEPTECVTRAHDVLLRQSTMYPPRLFASPGSGNVTLPRPRHPWRTDRRLTAVAGVVGSGVTGVSLRLTNGTTVAATVGHGWYLAWWPGSSDTNAYPKAIEITTATGVHQAPYSASVLRTLFRGCRNGERCTQFERLMEKYLLVMVPKLPAELKAHFKVFRTVAPARSTTDFKRLMTPQMADPWGLDLAEARVLHLGHSTAVIVVPGSAGSCIGYDLGVGGGASCIWEATAAEQGVISLGGSNGGTYIVAALVPDGNRTVSVDVDDRNVVLPVKDNIVFATFSLEPTQMTYKNAAGKRTVYP